MNKILSFVLALAFAFGVLAAMPLSAMADETYDLKIAGTAVTSLNAADILGDGVFSYDATKNILTVNGDYETSAGPVIINRIEGLTINVAADSYLRALGWTGIILYADTTITGTGTLSAYDIAAWGGTLTVDDARVSVYDIEGDSDETAYLYIKDSTVRTSRGVCRFKEIIFEGCEITAPSGAYVGKYAEEDDYVSIITGEGEYAYGVTIKPPVEVELPISVTSDITLDITTDYQDGPTITFTHDDGIDSIFTYPGIVDLVNVEDESDTLPLSIYNYYRYEDYAIKIGDEIITYSETSDYTNEPLTGISGKYDYIYVDSYGEEEDFAALGDEIKGAVVLCNRGVITFSEKANNAAKLGAAALIVVNNIDGRLNMALGDYEYAMPAVAIEEKYGQTIKNASEKDGDLYRGTLTVLDETLVVENGDSQGYTVMFNDLSVASCDYCLRIESLDGVTRGATYKAEVTYWVDVYYSDYSYVEYKLPDKTTVTLTVPDDFTAEVSEWIWAEDGSWAKAVIVQNSDPDVTATVLATVTEQWRSDPGDYSEGLASLTASVNYAGYEFSDSKLMTIPANLVRSGEFTDDMRWSVFLDTRDVMIGGDIGEDDYIVAASFDDSGNFICAESIRSTYSLLRVIDENAAYVKLFYWKAGTLIPNAKAVKVRLN